LAPRDLKRYATHDRFRNHDRFQGATPGELTVLQLRKQREPIKDRDC
jgi:hypothetical protein